jgi:Na+-transporting NADH:ubiquinone oxidoreductase subunit A
MQIRTKKGLNLPLKTKIDSKERAPKPNQIAVDLSPFYYLQLRLLAKEGSYVKIGDPVAQDKSEPKRVLVAIASGKVVKVRRGLKRRLLSIIIEVEEKEQEKKFQPVDLEKITKDALIEKLLEGGFFGLIKKRPFDMLASPNHQPRSIFIKALESAPFTIESDLFVRGYEDFFAKGLFALSKIAKVHLVFSEHSTFEPFIHAQNCEKHTAIGPHPISSQSIHIDAIDPIGSLKECVWTLNVRDTVAIGMFLAAGKIHLEQWIFFGGNGVLDEKNTLYKARLGFPIEPFLDRIKPLPVKYVSGTPLDGELIEKNGFLGIFDHTLCVLLEDKERQLFNFLRLKSKHYTATKTYFKTLRFSTSLNGERRAFIDGSIYQKVMPLNIPVIQLVKACLAKDFDKAIELGLLEVAKNDFSLCSFLDPSKYEMCDIIDQFLKKAAAEL